MLFCKQQSEKKQTEKSTLCTGTANDLSKTLLPNSNLMLLDIPEVTDGIFEELEIAALTNLNCVTDIEVSTINENIVTSQEDPDFEPGPEIEN